MSITAVLLICASSFQAAPESGVPVSIEYWAVDATTENRDTRHVDRALLPAKEALESLPFDTFRAVNTGFQAVQHSDEAVFKINSRYELRVRATCPDPGQSIRLEVSVLLHEPESDKDPVTALSTKLTTASGQKIAVRGLKLANGNDLVIVLSAST